MTHSETLPVNQRIIVNQKMPMRLRKSDPSSVVSDSILGDILNIYAEHGVYNFITTGLSQVYIVFILLDLYPANLVSRLLWTSL